MMILTPSAVNDLTHSLGCYPLTTYPLSNILLDSPDVPVITDSSVYQFGIRFKPASSITGISIHGLVGGTGSIQLVNITSGLFPANLKTYDVSDPYYTDRHSILWTFDTIPAGDIIEISMANTVAAAYRIGVLKAGLTATYANPQYPLTEDMADATTTIQMADGSIYRGAEITPSRVFTGTVMDSHANIKSLVATCRSLGGKATMFHLGEDVDDSLFVYGRQGQMPQRVIQAPNISAASINVREWV